MNEKSCFVDDWSVLLILLRMILTVWAFYIVRYIKAGYVISRNGNKHYRVPYQIPRYVGTKWEVEYSGRDMINIWLVDSVEYAQMQRDLYYIQFYSTYCVKLYVGIWMIFIFLYSECEGFIIPLFQMNVFCYKKIWSLFIIWWVYFE